jgi:hypothetical protein
MQNTPKKLFNVFYKCALEFNFAFFYGSGHLIFSKKVKIVVAEEVRAAPSRANFRDMIKNL